MSLSLNQNNLCNVGFAKKDIAMMKEDSIRAIEMQLQTMLPWTEPCVRSQTLDLSLYKYPVFTKSPNKHSKIIPKNSNGKMINTKKMQNLIVTISDVEISGV